MKLDEQEKKQEKKKNGLPLPLKFVVGIYLIYLGWQLIDNYLKGNSSLGFAAGGAFFILLAVSYLVYSVRGVYADYDAEHPQYIPGSDEDASGAEENDEDAKPEPEGIEEAADAGVSDTAYADDGTLPEGAVKNATGNQYTAEDVAALLDGLKN